ncbi:hypothetical protein LTR62_000911 [Meristemomyces frigidus]|uniref:FAD/NAD(P)-binding domain-containing protein n=1 Tax=Meristemomyces frigidus TaxID=1508187 RepID=A0AAN7YBX3_9PEZI|nr:hypothetical protein LTR62_000911 [Meristemomyces frigidus]
MTTATMATPLQADYLIVGAGAAGMAFADTLLSSSNKTMMIVDRYARPGGHWTVAYPFVRLHQPSSLYGVNSRPLGSDTVDEVGLNKGLSELAGRDEITAYYDQVMHQTFLPSERVQYFPKHEYLGRGRFRSLLTGVDCCVGPETRIVDGTYSRVKVPSVVPPAYSVAAGVKLVTPNNLSSITRPYANYTVCGAGKTGIDCCLWLLTNGVSADKITWIMPRDPLYMDRAGLQFGARFTAQTRKALHKTNITVMKSSSTKDLVQRLVHSELLLQLDRDKPATTFHAATVTHAELEQIRKIKNIIRKGRILRITTANVELTEGSCAADKDTLYVDCTASALAQVPPVPVFQNKTIILQTIRFCQPVFSAALIAFVEATYDKESTKNELCRVVAYPDIPADWPLLQLQSHLNTIRWSREDGLTKWSSSARLDWLAIPEKGAEMGKIATSLGPVCEKLRSLLDGISDERERRRVARSMERFENGALGQPSERL